jgi:NAD(P)-dependent dehydrogenase (short-subunit alcohol dehydrogenase family)
MTEQRLAVVTGVSHGIGAAVTDMLLAEGWGVVGLSRTPPAPRPGLYWFFCDISVPDVVTDILALAGIDTLDALVHCAGVRGPFGPFTENDPEAWAQTIQTNLMGTASVLRACLPLLQRSDDARVLLFSGGGAFSPEPMYSAYAATKGATVALMETLAEELSNTSTTINCIAPGFIATGIHKGTPHEHRPAAPDAMANVVGCVRHLLSPQTQGLTGRTVSAAWDDWRNLTPWTIPHLDRMGQRDRHLIAGLQRLLMRGRQAI